MPPERTCLGCRASRPKSILVRLTADSGALSIDRDGRLGGRGAYLCPERRCLDAALAKKGSFSRALRRTVATPEPDDLWIIIRGGVRPGQAVAEA
jgi:predicted RNA-binding protein YlxR (DUF448 family)